MSVQRVEYITIAVPDVAAGEEEYCNRFGFHAEAVVQGRVLLTQGRMRIVLESSVHSLGASYLARHDSGVSGIAVSVENVRVAFERAIKEGLAPVAEPQSIPGGKSASVFVFGDILLTFLEFEPNGVFVPNDFGFTVMANELAPTSDTGLEVMDHFAVAVPTGGLQEAVDLLTRALDFAVVFEENITIGRQGMNSKVIQDPDRQLVFTIVEQDEFGDPGQVSQFVESHQGAGVQHVAFLTSDIATSVKALDGRSVQLMKTPSAYYEQLAGERPDLLEGFYDLEVLRERSLLVDRDENGLLYQVFTRTIHPRKTMFFELVQREGARTFGSGNVERFTVLCSRMSSSQLTSIENDMVMSFQRTVPPASSETLPTGVRLQEIVERARRTIFYNGWLEGWQGESLQDLPTFCRRDIDADSWFPLSDPDARTWAQVFSTSGSTGTPLQIAFGSDDLKRNVSLLRERARLFGLSSDDVFLNTHGQGLWVGGPTLDALVRSVDAGLVPTGPGRSSRTLRMLDELPITALSATPSYLRYLVERAEIEGYDPRKWQLRMGFIGGECADIAVREWIIERLGDEFRWCELYGSTENGGPVLGYCPPWAHPGGVLLLDNKSFVVEFLTTTGTPAEVGDEAEIVISTMDDRCTPLLRYRTGDIIELLGTDHDGRPVTSSILRRIDDGFKIRGALVFPGSVERAVVTCCGPQVEWSARAWQREGSDVLSIVVEKTDKMPPADVIQGAIRDHIGVRAEIEFAAVGALNRDTHKSKRFKDERLTSDGGSV